MTSESGAESRNLVLRYLGRFTRLLLIIAIYALVLWYGKATTAHLDTPPVLTKIAVALVALGVTGSIYRILIDVANETKGAIVVLATFLNEKLVEPQRRRLRAEGRAEGRQEGRAEGREEGRAETIADIRSRLLRQGIDPDLILPPERTNGANPS